MKRDVGMFRCPRCDASFPRVLGKKRYLIIAEAELTRLRKDAEDLSKKNSNLEGAIRRSEKRAGSA